MITSLSGIRGIVNEDLSFAEVGRFAGNFASATGSKKILLARDSRATGPAMARAVEAGLLSRGTEVHDFGVISTPALFRQSRSTGLPAVMVSASHNEPEFNGLKFIVDGAGVGRDTFEAIVSTDHVLGEFRPGFVKPGGRPVYVDELASRFGDDSCSGVRVAIDLGGGAAISHTPELLKRLGCSVISLNDSLGVFNRRIDPVADDLDLLRKSVKTHDCDVGFAFDCDGDRLVVVDSQGRKRTGDLMLTLALSEMLRETGEKKIVVSLDTTQAVDEVARKAGATVFRSRVGEANVVGKMKEEGARLGGEGSSGGLIDGDFNYCRDSMLAGLVIARAIKRQGRKFFDSVPSYHIERVLAQVPKKKAQKGIKKLAAAYPDAEVSDGFKVMLSKHSWVLVRPSGTEDVVRVSAEAETSQKAIQTAKSFARRVVELSS